MSPDLWGSELNQFNMHHDEETRLYSGIQTRKDIFKTEDDLMP